MEVNLELLSIQNPWWTGTKRHPASLKFDPAIEQYNHQPLKWRPGVLDDLDLKQDKIYCLCGSKAVGKTTLAKLLIKQLIEEEKIDPSNLFYYSCHNLDSYEQLNEMIKLFLNIKNKIKARRYIFIDEVALIKNWRKGFEYLIRAGKFKNTTVILTASRAPEKKAKEDKWLSHKVINSLAFSEFSNLINPGFFNKVSQYNYQSLIKRIEYYLDIYLLTGGYISAINDYLEHGAVKQNIYSNFLNWFLVYIASANRDIVLIRQIMEELILNLGQPVGYKTLSHKTKAKTHLTAAEYLNILESMFVIKTVYQSEGGKPTSRKAKKIYFQDPFIFWLFYAYIHGSLNYWQLARERLHDSAVFSHLVENVVLSHLIKTSEIKVTYWRDNIRKKEINFLVERNKKITPILIRYTKEIQPADYKIFNQAGFKQGLIISRDSLENKNGIKVIPLTYFLLFYKNLI
jgi:uncharacterized protein